MTIKKNLKDINGVIGIRKDKQHKVQGKGKKRQITIYKTLHSKVNPTKTAGELICSGKTTSPCSTSETCRVTMATKPAKIKKRNNPLSPQIIENK
jgi:hypothetical protein